MNTLKVKDDINNIQDYVNDWHCGVMLRDMIDLVLSDIGKKDDKESKNEKPKT